MTVLARPYDDGLALTVFQHLDPWDWLEAEAVRGAPVTSLSLFADWRAMQAHRLGSWVATTDGRPFAVVAVGHTGQAGVAQAALLARRHDRFARPLAALGALIRRELPGFCAESGVRRIECRAWAGHPTAGRFLRALGFELEAAMPGFGGADPATFLQFAYLPDPPEEEPTHVRVQQAQGAVDRGGADAVA